MNTYPYLPLPPLYVSIMENINVMDQRWIGHYKVKSHFKNHENVCKGHMDYIKCDDCEKIFQSEKTLKQHKFKCKPFRKYKCDMKSRIVPTDGELLF